MAKGMLTEEQRRIVADYHSSVTQKWLPSVCPIFDLRSNRPLHGSSVLLGIGYKLFLITAAHVLDPINPESEVEKTELFVIANNDFVPLSRLTKEFIHSTKPRIGNRNNDSFDFAYIELVDNAQIVLDSFAFASMQDVDPHYQAKEIAIHLALGWPATKTKFKPIAEAIDPNLDQSYISYLSHLAGEDTYFALGKNPIEQIILPFSKKASIEHTNKKVIVPDPHGMSGGAFLSMENEFPLKDSNSLGKLVGIGIEYYAALQALVGVRIGLILERIRITHPELSDFIPYGSYNVNKVK